MAKIKIETASDYLKASQYWPPDFAENHKPTHYPCVMIVNIFQGTITDELIVVTHVYIDDFDGMTMNLKAITF